MLKSKLLGATAAAEVLAIEDVFSTYLYTGTGAAQTITNGIDLAGEGGMVWTKRRSGLYSHSIFDTNRGTSPGKLLSTDASNGEQTDANVLTAYNNNGYSLGSSVYNNASGQTYASWTFRQAPRFFDVVTYTGTGANRTIAHDLGVVPGCIIVKRTDTTGDWQVYHRSNTAAPETDYLVLNSTAATVDDNTRWNDTLPTSTVFSLGTNATVNASGGTYVAYLFAHDPLGPSGDGSDGLIACGSFTTDGSGNATVDLGWEPQWGLFKASNDTSNWSIVDNMRGWLTDLANQKPLYANLSNAESSGSNFIRLNATGFSVTNNALGTNKTYIYIAIRRGPMRQPTSGTEVFHPLVSSSAEGTQITTGFPVDAQIIQYTLGNGPEWIDRLRGVSTTNTSISTKYLYSASTAAETTATNSRDWGNTGYDIPAWWAGSSTAYWSFRRAPGFFDVVAYTGAGSSGRQKTHNLGVAPELLIVKSRSNVQAWSVLCTLNGGLQGRLNQASSLGPPSSAIWGDGSSYVPPTDTIFTVGTDNETNATGWTYIAYLFATLSGISKVGSYTGNGSSQTINCSFTGGARFVLIKRTDSTGDWYVWDTARGIVSGNDPHLSLNTTAAEVTSDDTIDPDSSGFIVNQVSATNVNVSSASYIYLAIA